MTLTMMNIQEQIRDVNVANGWRTPDVEESSAEQVARLALISTEVSEAIEEIRNGHAVTENYYVDGKPEGVPSELADVVIRAFDTADAWGIDLGRYILDKLHYNAGRGFRHGGKVL